MDQLAKAIAGMSIHEVQTGREVMVVVQTIGAETN